MIPWLLVLVSYLLGAIPSGYLAGRLARGIDLREHGSGNLGATNTFRVLGAGVAAPVMVFDVLKGWFPTFFFPLWDTSGDWRWSLAYGAAAIVGHVLPVYMGFRGGKGVATAGGVFLALAPLAVGVALVAWLLTVGISRIVSLASLTAVVALVAVLFLVDSPATVRSLGLVTAAFVFFAHRSNMRRIVRGEEYRFGQKKAGRELADLEAAVREEEAN